MWLNHIDHRNRLPVGEQQPCLYIWEKSLFSFLYKLNLPCYILTGVFSSLLKKWRLNRARSQLCWDYVMLVVQNQRWWLRSTASWGLCCPAVVWGSRVQQGCWPMGGLRPAFSALKVFLFTHPQEDKVLFGKPMTYSASSANLFLAFHALLWRLMLTTETVGGCFIVFTLGGPQGSHWRSPERRAVKDSSEVLSYKANCDSLS